MHIHIHMHIHILLNLHSHIHIHINLMHYVYVYIYTYIYIYWHIMHILYICSKYAEVHWFLSLHQTEDREGCHYLLPVAVSQPLGPWLVLFRLIRLSSPWWCDQRIGDLTKKNDGTWDLGIKILRNDGFKSCERNFTMNTMIWFNGDYMWYNDQWNMHIQQHIWQSLKVGANTII